jgi:hypothetical protein
MKIQITLKDPDGFYEAIREAAKKQVAEIPGLDQYEKDEIADHRHEEIAEYLKRWVQYGEYITIEFDLEEANATVKKQP